MPSLRPSLRMQALIQQTAKMALTSDKRSNRIEIDGSILEGGGQILRNASAYACIRRKPVQITNIRGKRPVPGLKQQHISGLQLLERISGGILEGGRIQSSEIHLRPGNEGIMEAEFTSDQGGGGSTMLVFQSALPVLLFAGHETKLILKGGTDAMSKAPPIDFTKHILLPFLQKHFRIECTLDIRKRGFSSYGGGEAFVTIEPLEHPLKCISLLDRGQITSFTGVVWSARQEYPSVSASLEKAVTAELKKKFPEIPLKFTRNPPTPASTPGIGMLLYAETANGHRIASSTLVEIPTRAQPGSLSKQEVKARDRGTDLVRRVNHQISLGGTVDEYLTDQIVIFMALATSGVVPPLASERGVTADGKGKRRCEVLVGEVSLHSETAMRIAEKMLDNITFSTKKVEGIGIIMTCERKD